MAFAVSLSQVIKEYYWINYPVTIFGASSNSGAGWGARKVHFGKIEDMPFLPKGLINRWDPKIPLIWSGHTTNAQAIFDVFTAFNINRNINYSNFYASMMVNEPMLRKYIYPLVLKLSKSNLIFHFPLQYINMYLKQSFMSIYLNLRYMIGKFKFEVIKINNVDECMQELKKLKF